MASVLMAVGPALGAYGQIQSGQAANQAAKYNANIAKQNAAITLQQAGLDADAQQRAAKGIIGEEKANYGASGVSGGSVNDVLMSSETSAELDRQNILYRGKLRAMGLMSDAQLDKFSGRQAVTQSYFGAASSLLTGGANISSKMPVSAPTSAPTSGGT